MLTALATAGLQDGKTALDIAREKKIDDMILILGDREERLIEASKRGEVETVEAVLKEGGVVLDRRNRDGSTALLEAVIGGHADIANMLVKAGADLAVAGTVGRRRTQIAGDASSAAFTANALPHATSPTF